MKIKLFLASALCVLTATLSAEALERAGISPTLLRISAGLEAVEDIIEDFEQAFAQI